MLIRLLLVHLHRIMESGRILHLKRISINVLTTTTHHNQIPTSKYPSLRWHYKHNINITMPSQTPSQTGHTIRWSLHRRRTLLTRTWTTFLTPSLCQRLPPTWESHQPTAMLSRNTSIPTYSSSNNSNSKWHKYWIKTKRSRSSWITRSSRWLM